MGEPNVNYNSKSKREVIRGRWRSEEDGEEAGWRRVVEEGEEEEEVR